MLICVEALVGLACGMPHAIAYCPAPPRREGLGRGRVVGRFTPTLMCRSEVHSTKKWVRTCVWMGGSSCRTWEWGWACGSGMQWSTLIYGL